MVTDGLQIKYLPHPFFLSVYSYCTVYQLLTLNLVTINILLDSY